MHYRFTYICHSVWHQGSLLCPFFMPTPNIPRCCLSLFLVFLTLPASQVHRLLSPSPATLIFMTASSPQSFSVLLSLLSLPKSNPDYALDFFSFCILMTLMHIYWIKLVLLHLPISFILSYQVFMVQHSHILGLEWNTQNSVKIKLTFHNGRKSTGLHAVTWAFWSH